MWTRRRVRNIPKAGCDGGANDVHIQKARRPEGFPANGWMADATKENTPGGSSTEEQRSQAPIGYNSTPPNLKQALRTEPSRIYF